MKKTNIIVKATSAVVLSLLFAFSSASLALQDNSNIDITYKEANAITDDQPSQGCNSDCDHENLNGAVVVVSRDEARNFFYKYLVDTRGNVHYVPFIEEEYNLEDLMRACPPHTWTPWQPVQKACFRYCTLCGASELYTWYGTQGHGMPSYQSNGYSGHKHSCSQCGYVYNSNAPHDFNVTYMGDGIYQRKCKLCSYTDYIRSN